MPPVALVPTRVTEWWVAHLTGLCLEPATARRPCAAYAGWPERRRSAPGALPEVTDNGEALGRLTGEAAAGL
jgi:hypothetical protein